MKKIWRKALIALGLLLVFLTFGYLGCVESKDWDYVTNYRNLWDLLILSMIIAIIPFTGWLCSKETVVHNWISLIILIIFIVSMALTMSSEYIEDIEGLFIGGILTGPASIINWMTTPPLNKKK